MGSFLLAPGTALYYYFLGLSTLTLDGSNKKRVDQVAIGCRSPAGRSHSATVECVQWAFSS
jgi:hypothetical protein